MFKLDDKGQLLFFEDPSKKADIEKYKELSGNRGEWSEPYVVLKLLAEGRLAQADDNLQPSKTDFAQVLGVKRGDLEAVYDDGDMIVFTYIDQYGRENTVMTKRELVEVNANRLFKAIATIGAKDGAFSLPDIASELRRFGFARLTNPPPLKKKNEKVTKRDLTIHLQSIKLGNARLGFSVKSELGAPPTLLNASEATNIVYRVKGLSAEDAEEINNISGSRKIMDRCAKIKQRATSIEFVRFSNSTFADNLDVVDSSLPGMLADLVKVHYFEQILQPRKKAAGQFREADRLDKAVEILSQSDAYKLKPRADYCEIKIKKFLYDCALGLMPSTSWNGVDDASGGYVIVLPDGQLIALYVYNKNLFGKYLFENTIFERASTTRHKYMKLEPDGDTGDYLLKLNLQIRFCD